MKTIKNMHDFEKPYEKFLNKGVAALTDIELLAIIIRSGNKKTDVFEISENLLKNSRNQISINALLQKDYEDYIQIPGIGNVKATQLVCIRELTKRLWRAKHYEKDIIFNSPELCAKYYMQELKGLEREELRVAFLDIKLKMKSDCIISVGTVSSSLVSAREILIEALKHKAVSIILIHNHPSGNPKPSNDDIDVTSKVNIACKSVGIALSDHIIIGDNTYYSFKKQGVL